jgi:GT2 family glycosyltransferase
VSTSPSASVIVPTHNRATALRRCLDALAAQRHGAFEVVVVDDGGSESLSPVVAAFEDRMDLVLVRQRRTGPGGARNRGAARARGCVLVFTDDDCRPEAEWLPRLVARCGAEPGVGAGGRTVNELASAWSEVAQIVVDLGYETANRDPSDARFFASNNLALPAAGFHAIGGFDPLFATAEDRDLCDRWRAAGRRLVSVPEAVVRHAHHLDLRDFLRLQARYGRGTYRFRRAHARRAGQAGLGRGWVDPDYYRRAARLALRGSPASSAPALAVRLGVWQLAYTLGFAEAWARSAAARRS